MDGNNGKTDDPNLEKDANLDPNLGNEDKGAEDLEKDKGKGKEDDDNLDPFRQTDDEDDDGAGDDKGKGKGNDDDVSLDDADQEAVRKIVDRTVTPKMTKIEQRMFQAERVIELQGFLESNEGKVFKQFGSKIIGLAKDPRLSNLKIEAIAAMACAKDLMKLGASMRSQADAEASQDNMSGGSARQREVKSSLPDPSAMSSAQFEEAKKKFMGKK